jgi:hypothetical protein
LNFPVEIEITHTIKWFESRNVRNGIRIQTAKQSMMVVETRLLSVSSNQILWLKTESLN